MQGFAQAHVVGKAAAEAVFMEESEPVEAVLLVGAQGGAQGRGGRDRRLFGKVLQAVVARLQFEQVVGALFEVCKRSSMMPSW